MTVLFNIFREKNIKRLFWGVTQKYELLVFFKVIRSQDKRAVERYDITSCFNNECPPRTSKVDFVGLINEVLIKE